MPVVHIGVRAEPNDEVDTGSPVCTLYPYHFVRAGSSTSSIASIGQAKNHLGCRDIRKTATDRRANFNFPYATKTQGLLSDGAESLETKSMQAEFVCSAGQRWGSCSTVGCSRLCHKETRR